MKCLNCGKENREEDIYCSECGKKLPKVNKLCSNCNTLNNLESLYCKECGNSLDNEKNILLVENDRTKSKDNSALAYQIISILSICVNFLYSSSLFMFHIFGLAFGIVSLNVCKKQTLKETNKFKSIKTCSIIGIVISSICIALKILFVIMMIIEFVETGVKPETPDHSYFF